MINDYLMQVQNPYKDQYGTYSATFNRNGEPLFLRMELLTKRNELTWSHFKSITLAIANSTCRGALSTLICFSEENYDPYDESVIQRTGFTKEEYTEFIKKAIALKKKTNNKIVHLLQANQLGSSFMDTHFEETKKKYIVYITKNPSFSIEYAYYGASKYNLKTFIEHYGDILISIGSDFSKTDSFHNRGISRNPHWVFEEKYSGLSMLLHSFIGAVATKYFPEKKFMHVQPMASMQCIITKNLLRGEGYIRDRSGAEIDVTDLKVDPYGPECSINDIKVSALNRIYELWMYKYALLDTRRLNLEPTTKIRRAATPPPSTTSYFSCIILCLTMSLLMT